MLLRLCNFKLNWKILLGRIGRFGGGRTLFCDFNKVEDRFLCTFSLFSATFPLFDVSLASFTVGGSAFSLSKMPNIRYQLKSDLTYRVSLEYPVILSITLPYLQLVYICLHLLSFHHQYLLMLFQSALSQNF